MEGLDDVERTDEFPDWIGGEAVIEMERNTPQQMISGDQQAPLGLEQAHVRGGVPGGLVRRPRAEVGVDDHPLHERPVGLHDPGDPRFARLPFGGVAAQRLLGDAALTCDLEPAGQRGAGFLRPAKHVLVVGMHPQLTARALNDRRRLAVVV